MPTLLYYVHTPLTLNNYFPIIFTWYTVQHTYTCHSVTARLMCLHVIEFLGYQHYHNHKSGIYEYIRAEQTYLCLLPTHLLSQIINEGQCDEAADSYFWSKEQTERFLYVTSRPLKYVLNFHIGGGGFTPLSVVMLNRVQPKDDRWKKIYKWIWKEAVVT